MVWKPTFRNLDALYGFIPHSSSALLDEFVSLKTDVKNFGTLDAERDDFVHGVTDDISGQLDGNK